MQESNQNTNAKPLQTTPANVAGAPASDYVAHKIGKRVVNYTLLSNSDLLVLRLLNTASTLFFSVAAFLYGNVYLNIQIQSIFATSLSVEQISVINVIKAYSNIFIWIFIILGVISFYFSSSLLNIAKVESESSSEKGGFFKKLVSKIISVFKT